MKRWLHLLDKKIIYLHFRREILIEFKTNHEKNLALFIKK